MNTNLGINVYPNTLNANNDVLMVSPDIWIFDGDNSTSQWKDIQLIKEGIKPSVRCLLNHIFYIQYITTINTNKYNRTKNRIILQLVIGNFLE